MDNDSPKKKKATPPEKNETPEKEPESVKEKNLEVVEEKKIDDALTPTVPSKTFFSLEEKKLLNKTGLSPLFLLLGLVVIIAIGFVVWKNLPLNKNQIIQPTNSQSFNPVTKEPVSFTLELINPDDEMLVFENSLVVSGKTTPKTVIVINNDGEYLITEADQSGDFSKVVVLDSGLNTILVHGVDPQGNIKEDHRTVYYSEEKL